MNRRFIISILVAIVSLLMIATAVFAEFNPGTGSSFGSWNDIDAQWQNGNIVMELPGDDGVQPFLVKLGFNNNVVTDACGPGTETKWAGYLTLAHEHEDNDPDGAPGFGNTGNWQAVKCSDLNVSGPTGDVRIPTGDTIFGTCTDGAADPTKIGSCEVIEKDVIVACTTGNCKTEIQTTLQGNLDTDCNGLIDRNEPGNPLPDFTLDSQGRPDDLCFYWTAVKPPFDTTWKGNIQSSVEGLSGESTINFSDQFVPTAISLIEFAAEPSPLGPSMGMAVLLPLGLLGLAASVLLWRRASFG